MELDDNGMVKTIQADKDAVIQLGDAVDTLGDKSKSFGRTVEVAIGQLAANAVTRLADALRSAAAGVIQFGSEVESSLAELSAITGITGSNLERLGETAIRESMKTGVAASEQIEAFKLLASNIDIATIGGVAGLEKLGSQVILLKQAAGVDLAQATDIVAGAINSFGLEATEGARVVNLLAAGSKFGAAEVGDLGAALKNSAATARGANVSIETTVGALEVMSQNFLKGGEAGTGLRNVMSILQSESKKLADAGLKGINLESDGLSATLVKLQPLLNNAAALTEIFGRENANAARILIQNADAVETMTAKVTDTNTAQEQAAIRTATFQNSVDRLMATIQGVGIETFQAYSGQLKGIVDLTIQGINFLRQHSDEVMTVAQVLGTAAAAVAAYNAVVKTQTLITNAATIAQRILNTAMKLNPVGLVIAGLTAVVLLFTKFRDKVADAAAVLIDFGITVINSFKAVGDALGIEAVGKGVDFIVAKMEGLQTRLRGYAEDVRTAKGETEFMGGSFGGAGAGAEDFAAGLDTATGALDENSAAIDNNVAKLKQQQLQMELNRKTAAAGQAPGDITLEPDALDLGPELEIGRLDTLKGINILLQDNQRLLNEASTQTARDQILLQIEALDALKAAMMGNMTEAEMSAKKIEEAEKSVQDARQKSLASQIASVAASKNAGRSAAAAAVSQALTIINTEIGKAIAKAVASIPFPLNLILGAGAGAAVKSLIQSQIPAFATGGTVTGPGGTDRVLTRLTAGEEVINAKASARNRPLLKAINAGATFGGDGAGAMDVNVHVTGRLHGDGENITATINETNTSIDNTRGQVRTRQS